MLAGGAEMRTLSHGMSGSPGESPVDGNEDPQAASRTGTRIAMAL